MQRDSEVQGVMVLTPFGMVKGIINRQLLGHFQRGNRDVKASLMLGTGSTLTAGRVWGQDAMLAPTHSLTSCLVSLPILEVL